MTTIKLKNGSGAPTAGDLVQGEPALDLTNKRLYTEDSGGTVIEVGTNPTSITTGDITATGTATFANLATSGDVTFGDNDKAIFGAGSDLQIYHDGSNSFITENGTGYLGIGTNGSKVIINKSPFENMAEFITDGAVNLYHNNALKLATSSSGIDVTGEVKGDSLEIGTAFDGATVEITSAVTDFTLGSVTTGADLLFSYNRGSGTTTISEGTRGSETALQQWAGNGDISFYNSAGTSQDLYWDASTSRLGLGTGATLPSSTLDVGGELIVTGGGSGTILVNDEDSSLCPTMTFTRNGGGTITNDFIKFKNSGGEVAAINSFGGAYFLNNVGIGTTSPAVRLQTNVANASTEAIRITNDADSVRTHMLPAEFQAHNSDLTLNAVDGYATVFKTTNTESMRIDSSGNVVIGDSTAKTRLQSSGAGAANAPSLGSASSNAPLYLTNNDVAYGLVAGTNTVDGHAWLQAQRTDGTATAYNITLNEAGGNVGIGTASASNKLTVNGDQVLLANGELKFADATNNQVGTIRNSGSAATSQLEFLTGSTPTERMRIDSSGNLLVGKTSSGIGTVGHELGATGYAYHTRDGGSVLDLNRKTSDGNIVKFYKDGTTVGSISVTASATTYNTSSDQRLKDNIVDAPSASDDIDAIQVRSFDWKADGSHQKYGMVAQELQGVVPEAVTEGDTEEDMMGVDYSKLVPMLVKEIQSLRARVAQLEGAN